MKAFKRERGWSVLNFSAIDKTYEWDTKKMKKIKHPKNWEFNVLFISKRNKKITKIYNYEDFIELCKIKGLLHHSERYEQLVVEDEI